jgi:hypothetical protein
MELWKTLDPEGKFENSYNRYAHSRWKLRPGPEIFMEAIGDDALHIYIDPRHEILRKLGVTHLLVVGEASFFRANPGSFDPLFTYTDKHVFRLRSARLP